jgi:hypothetical protein
MAYQFNNPGMFHPVPVFVIRENRPPYGWSVWAVIEGMHPEEVFECQSQQEATKWINVGSKAWLAARAQKRLS